ncbi:MAG: hypothetical protein HQ541_06195, partial [Mariniphaga sp.]|nr:hypothetical protein [Mariniphaga sp.]
MRTKYLSFLILLIFLSFNSIAQISQGGSPIETMRLKKANIPVLKMPKIDNNLLLKSSVERYANAEVLKPFKFAHSFEVNFTPENSGQRIV